MNESIDRSIGFRFPVWSFFWRTRISDPALVDWILFCMKRGLFLRRKILHTASCTVSGTLYVDYGTTMMYCRLQKMNADCRLNASVAAPRVRGRIGSDGT